MSEAAPVFRRTVTGLALLALILCAYPLIRAFYLFEIDFNEGWNGYLQHRAMASEPLYTGYSLLYFNNYPPLSFHLTGWLAAVLGDPVLAGRLISLAALGVIAWCCSFIVRKAGGERAHALLASATCLLLFAVFATDYLGMNDPQLLGQAFATGALALHLGGAPSLRRTLLTALLLTASVLTKHNLVLVPLLIAFDVARNGPQRQRIAFFSLGTALAALAAGLLWASAGWAFFDQLLASRTWQVERAFLFTTEVLGRFQAPLALVGIALYAARRSRPAGLILAYMLLALAAGAYFSGGAGTDINVFFDISIALAIGAGLAAIEVQRRGFGPRALVAFALAANAGALFQSPLALGRFGVDMAGEMAMREQLFVADAVWLKARAGKAVCESALLCLRAGKPMFYDSFNANQAMLAGRLPADTLTGMLQRGEIAVVQVSSRAQRQSDDPPGAQAMPTRFINFEDDTFAALQRYYKLERSGISGRFYTPKQGL